MSGWPTRRRRHGGAAWLAAALLMLPCTAHRAHAEGGTPPSADGRGKPDADSATPAARPRIGLVLSGGGARGAAHIGVLKVLEELRVPVDCIAGTSMGSIVGGSYASGQRIDEMERDVALIKTETLAQDEPSRRDLATRLKESDRLSLFGPQFGWSADGLTLPKGVVTGVALEAVLRDLALARGESDFDQLPIPFRAIATDVVSGRMVVLGRGDLAVAMRASMSVPGAVAPVQLGEQLLVDGGLTRNLPVDVARSLCADVVIAVNLGTSLLKRDQISSGFSVAAQMLNILTEQNVQTSLAELRPQDVLIQPELGNFSAADFDGMPSTIPIGEAAARKVAEPADALQRARGSVRRAPRAAAAAGGGRQGHGRRDPHRRPEPRQRRGGRAEHADAGRPAARRAGARCRPAPHLRARRLRACQLPPHRRAGQACAGGAGAGKDLGPRLRALRAVAGHRFQRRQRLQRAGQLLAHLDEPARRRVAHRSAAGGGHLRGVRVLPAAGAQPVFLHRPARAGVPPAGRHLQRRFADRALQHQRRAGRDRPGQPVHQIRRTARRAATRQREGRSADRRSDPQRLRPPARHRRGAHAAVHRPARQRRLPSRGLPL